MGPRRSDKIYERRASQDGDKDRYVNVRVPAQYVTEVREFVDQLAHREAGRSAWKGLDLAARRGAEPARLELEDTDFSTVVREASPLLGRALRYLAAHPDEWIPTSVLAEALGLPQDSRILGGTLSGLSRRARSDPFVTWPFHRRRNRRLRQAEYMMPMAVAERLSRWL